MLADKVVANAILSESPIQLVNMKGYNIYIKRDDLLNSYFSGNKARKFSYFINNDFPRIKKIVSYGSIQANSLYSLAALAQINNWQLDYYVSRIPTWLKKHPLGNYGGALHLGANIIEAPHLKSNLDDFMHEHACSIPSDTLFIPEGGRSELAQYGIAQLAKEISLFCQDNSFAQPIIMLPSGTGTTALYLQAWFNEQSLPYKVLTCSCVGDDKYLRKQFEILNTNKLNWPTILSPLKKYHFGKLYPELYQLWQQLFSETNIEFDLLYDPLGWQCLLEFMNKKPPNSEIIYIHQGGIIGNESMLPRYLRKYRNVMP